MSLFCCPLCGAPLHRDAHTYRCHGGHCYDIAKEGYTYLLPVNRRHSKSPGDDKAMTAARSDFLSKGYYGFLQQALCELAVSCTGENPAVLDVGCGEGYYTAALCQALAAAGKKPRIAGIDISKDMARRAAKKVAQAEIAVASAYHLPLADAQIDLLLDCFSPLAIDEFHRVLKPGGHFLYVVPAAEHLWEMKQVLYDRPYRNETGETPYDGFRYVTVRHVCSEITLPCQSDIQALFGMTPYCWKTPRAGKDRLAALDSLTTTAAFDIHVFERLNGKATPMVNDAAEHDAAMAKE